jgi:hypothetical protein
MDSDYATQVTPADKDNPMKIKIYNKTKGNIIFSENFSLPA